MLCFSRLSPEAESVSSRCRSISEWVIAAESPYQPHFLLGSEEREKKQKTCFLCDCCATICIYNPFQNKMKCRRVLAGGICSSQGWEEWFPCLIAGRCGGAACQSRCQNELSWRCERGRAHLVLYAPLECHHLWGPALNHTQQRRADSQQTVTVMTQLWIESSDVAVIVTEWVPLVVFLVLIIHCITWMYDEPDNGGWGFWLSGPEAPRQSLVWMSPVNPPVCGSYYAFISYRAGFSNWAWMKSTKQIKAALCSCCDQWPTGTSRNKTWLAGMDLNSCETIMVESGLVKKTWLL